jgi:hypothetical protein
VYTVAFDRTHGTIAVGDGRCVLDVESRMR